MKKIIYPAQEKVEMFEIVIATQALITDVRNRYPNEEFYCPYMKKLAMLLDKFYQE